MGKNGYKNLISAVILSVLLVFIVLKLALPKLLKAYIETGMGNCQTIPILCMAPEENVINPAIQQRCIIRLMPSTKEIPKISVCVPEGFTLVEERVKKVFYKKRPKFQDPGAVIYLLYEKPDFFMGLFPRLKKQGITDDYEFIKRVMSAKLPEVTNVTDAFFVIMKGIFIPDLGNQQEARMTQFSIDDKRGFLNYNLGKPDNYFDCDVFNKEGDFFKVYIKDKGARLDLDMVFAIISTLKKADAK